MYRGEEYKTITGSQAVFTPASKYCRLTSISKAPLKGICNYEQVVEVDHWLFVSKP